VTSGATNQLMSGGRSLAETSLGEERRLKAGCSQDWLPHKLLTLCFVASCCAAAVTRSVWDGVYTKQQANRGQTTYQEVCLKCHGENLGGGEGGPALAGEDFRRKWNGKTAGDLFGLIRKTMPSDDPGSLSSREYSDLVAYVLSGNEFPAGPKELDRDIAALNEIVIEIKR
jgi:mono/diheme cytochrome c family protein